MRRIIVVSTAIVFAACGGGGDEAPHYDGSTNLTGTGGTLPFTATEAMALFDGQTCTGIMTSSESVLEVLAADAPGMCSRLASGQDKAGMGGIALVVLRWRLGTAQPGIRGGAYDVSQIVTQQDGTVEYATAIVLRNDAACVSTSVDAVSGTITISSASWNGAAGSVDLELSDGGRVTGSFSAAACGLDIGDLCTDTSGLPATTTCLP